jgi:hypothetical protein
MNITAKMYCDMHQTVNSLPEKKQGDEE